ncbi:MAG: CHC2 zinc finger domain-containing protein [Verrucomicrobiota bacterium]
MIYDLDLIKERLTLRVVFERDGHRLAVRGGRAWTICPVHEESTASCHVDEKKGLWKCHGCGAGGDVFSYWQETRSCDFKSAAAALADVLGGVATVDHYERPERVTTAEVEPIVSLGGQDLERWQEGVAFLCKNEEQVARIAEWRGFGPEMVREMAEAGKLGMPRYFGVRREAFAVEALCPVEKKVVLAGYHVRLPPMEGSKKAEWRFVQAPGTGAWPFVIGDIATAKALLIFEGQWDAMAMVDAGGFGVAPESVAIVGIRGATGWRKFLQYEWSPEAQAFLFADADAAGATWFDPDGFAAQMKRRCRAIHKFKPSGDGVKDFNDLHKLEGRGSQHAWRAWLRKQFLRGLKKRRSRAKNQPTNRS